MPNSSPVAPKERINISYRPSQESTEEKELPLKLLLMGDLTQQENSTPIEQRKPIRIDKNNFDDVLKSQQIKLDLNVKNCIRPQDERLTVNFNPQCMRDFSPDGLVEQIPELTQLLALRRALVSLKSPLGNVPAFRKKLQRIIQNPDTRKRLLLELGLSVIEKTEENK